jgi:hypothetical protein
MELPALPQHLLLLLERLPFLDPLLLLEFLLLSLHLEQQAVEALRGV